MKRLTYVNLSVNGLYRGSLVYPRINNIKSIEYHYDTYRDSAQIDFNCESSVNSIADFLVPVISHFPRNFSEIQVNLKSGVS